MQEGPVRTVAPPSPPNRRHTRTAACPRFYSNASCVAPPFRIRMVASSHGSLSRCSEACRAPAAPAGCAASPQGTSHPSSPASSPTPRDRLQHAAPQRPFMSARSRFLATKPSSGTDRPRSDGASALSLPPTWAFAGEERPFRAKGRIRRARTRFRGQKSHVFPHGGRAASGAAGEEGGCAAREGGRRSRGRPRRARGRRGRAGRACRGRERRDRKTHVFAKSPKKPRRHQQSTSVSAA